MTGRNLVSEGSVLDRPVALVTGASRGIGRAVMCHLARIGMDVIGIARSREPLLEARDEACEFGSRALVVDGDITNERVTAQLFETISEEYGRLDVLVNNAGIALFGDVQKLPSKDVARVLDLDVVAAYRCTQEAVKLMLDTTGTGKIISIGSVRSHWTEWGDAGAYNAAKAGLHAMMESIARQFHESLTPISVGMVCPGAVEMHDGPPCLEKIPMESVAKAVAHAATAPPEVNVFDTVLIPIGQSPW